MVSSSDRTDCECKYDCMISHGCFIIIPKPFNVDLDYGMSASLLNLQMRMNSEYQ